MVILQLQATRKFMALQSVFQEKCLLIFKLLVFAISIVMAPIHIGAECSRGAAAINVAPFSGEVVHTYIGFIAANGKDMSNSFYTGELTV
jgi:hypothetical protein